MDQYWIDGITVRGAGEVFQGADSLMIHWRLLLDVFLPIAEQVTRSMVPNVLWEMFLLVIEAILSCLIGVFFIGGFYLKHAFSTNEWAGHKTSGTNRFEWTMFLLVIKGIVSSLIGAFTIYSH